MLRTIIIDDEAHVRETLASMLKDYCPQAKIVCESASVNELPIEGYLSLYPNPAQQEINIKLEDYVIDVVCIYTLTGQQVFQERPVNGTIDISRLKAGMYIVEVTIDNIRLRQKLLVQR